LLALRMGLPIFLLLVTSLFLFAVPQVLESLVFKVTLLSISVLTIVYYIFYLINESATSSVIDSVTNTYNRKHIFIALHKMQKRGVLQSISLIRIKNISDLNNHYGYEKANLLLKTFAKTVDEYLKNEGDEPRIGRLQGSDFVIGSFLPPQKMQSLLLHFQSQYDNIENMEIAVASAVSVNSNDVLKNIEHLYDSLHQKLQKADKNDIYIQDIQNLSKFEQEIVEAVNQGSFELLFKPNMELNSKSIKIYETIIKLQTKSFGTLATKKYIPVINRLDLEQSFDLAIIKSIAQIVKDSQSDFSISFNISPFSLRSKEFATKLFDVLEDSGVQPSRLIIELYENKVYHDINRYKKTLNMIKSFGVKLCLDNFGAMNASLEYIKYLPIDIVQFDNQFSKNLNVTSYRATLKAFIKMCKEMHVQTILKWIDDDDAKDIAKEFEVDFIQGFSVGKLLTKKDLR